MSTRICRHPLRAAAHAPVWLVCDIHRASFAHQPDCPGHGTPDCITRCAGGTPTDVQLLGMAVELLEQAPAEHSLLTPCGAIPPDLARALTAPMNRAHQSAARGGSVPEDITTELVAVARTLLGRAR